MRNTVHPAYLRSFSSMKPLYRSTYTLLFIHETASYRASCT